QIEMSISELENSLSIELFPNPSSQYLNIRISQNAVGQKFELLDLTGRIILSNRINATQETIDLSGFAEGQYALRCLNTIKMFSIIK
ncbi:MAG: T9SS type A sorting domain-containing protein, partial [Bacteroidota bacterium]